MASLFRPPAASRAAKTLDRALFSRTLPSTAAVVRDNRMLSRYRKDLEATRELLNVDKLRPIVSHPDPAQAGQGLKCLLLDPGVKQSGMLALLSDESRDEILLTVVAPESWSARLKDALDAGDLSLIPYNVDIDYSYWSYGGCLCLCLFCPTVLFC